MAGTCGMALGSTRENGGVAMLWSRAAGGKFQHSFLTNFFLCVSIFAENRYV